MKESIKKSFTDYPCGLMILAFVAFSMPVFPQEQTQTTYTETELSMSEHFDLTPAEIRKWTHLKETQQFHGLVQSDLSVYEMLALATNDEAELRRLARLFAQMNLRLIKKLVYFDELYQEAIGQLGGTQ